MKSGELIDLDTKKKLLIDMLKDIVNFCENNNINYFLSEGTMLGAVRHKGFIPWDDDIDIMMDLDNYNNFFNNFKSEKYKALNSENDKEYYYSFGKVVDTRTYIKEYGNRNISNMGLYIDIFPVLNFSNNKFIRKVDLFKNEMYSKFNFYYRINKEELIKRNNYDFKNSLLFNLFHNNINGLKRRNRNLLKLGSKSKTNYNFLSGSVYKEQAINSRYVDDYIYMDFEGLKCRIPKKYDEYLKSRYHNYMELPPIDKRVCPHSNDVFWR